ncbi:MAG: hypothetical protein NW218_07345 [Saprospiraceae bacterium]|nr:hypothetical protein [Saprospiraceae bacterium]
MQSVINILHSYNRYLVLAAMVFVLYRSLSGWLGKKPFLKEDNTASLILLITAHTQLLLGLIQYFGTSGYTKAAFANMGAAMKDPILRYFAVEHITAMLLAIVLIQLGRTFSKKASNDLDKHKKLAIYTGIAALIIIGTLASKNLLFGSVATAAL